MMNITCYPYQIPFKKPFKAGERTYKNRDGVILELKKDGITAHGEAAPLPGFSNYNVQEVQSQLKSYSSEIKELLSLYDPRTDANSFYQKNNIAPSLCFALDTLIIDCMSQKNDTSASTLLFENHNSSIPINGVVGSAGIIEMQEKAEHLITQGFTTLKFKASKKVYPLAALLQKLRVNHPDITFRVDANRTWSLQEAVKNLDAIEEIDIEYCEEPLADPSPKNLKALKQTTAVPLALDETISQTDKLQNFLPYISYIILKPMVLGAFSKLFATKALADTHDTTTVFTSSLESGIGRMMTATLASGLGAIQTAHGLATGSLLTMDVCNHGTYINNGYFTLPNYIGLGKRHKPNLKNIATHKFEL